MTFRRPELAREMAEQLLQPRALNLGIRSGLFLGGSRRVGKTTFLRGDLIPALQERGAVVVYVDLWADTTAKPTDLLRKAIVQTLADLQKPASKALQLLSKVKGLELAAAGFKFGFKVDSVGANDGVTLAEAFTQLVDQARTDIVVIVDEVQHVLGSEEGHGMLLSLKAARDSINSRPDTPGYFLFLGTGSHRARVKELTLKGNQAFNGALSQDFPLLGRDFVQWLLDELRVDLGTKLPSVEATCKCFARLGNRPEELFKAMRVLVNLQEVPAPDAALAAATEALRQSAADVDLSRLEMMGPLALAVFRKVAMGDPAGVRGLFATATVQEYEAQIGRKVASDEIQPTVGALVDGNFLARDSHGVYVVSDPFLIEPFKERELQAKLLGS
jgi:hypothetical protein